jgi:hypothetical protein
MSQRLAYGYHLGGYHNGWQVEEANHLGALKLPWYDDTDGDLGFAEAVEERCGAVLRELHVELFVFGYQTAEYVLALQHSGSVTHGWASPLTIRPLCLMPPRPWAQNLTRALQLLGMTPRQKEPQWLTCVSYG